MRSMRCVRSSENIARTIQKSSAIFFKSLDVYQRGFCVVEQVDICTQLISVGGVRPEDIAILSPYNAQVAQIKEKLKKRHQLEKITVTTITKSQGNTLKSCFFCLINHFNYAFQGNDKIVMITLHN